MYLVSRWLFNYFFRILTKLHLVIGVTKKLRNGFDNISVDIQALRDEMMDLFDSLDAVEDGMKSRLKGIIPKDSGSYVKKSFMGSRQMLYGASQTDLRGSSYSLATDSKR